MRVGIIAPIKFLKEYCITDVQYCLPSLIINSETYRNFYLHRRELGNIIILDSTKIGWVRKPEDIRVVQEALKILQPSMLILPSYMFNYRKTIQVASEWTGRIRGLKLVGCLEGASLQEIRKCREKIKGVNQYAIPSHLHNIYKITKHGSPLVYIENHSWVEELSTSLDGILLTSLPVRLGLQGRVLSNYKPRPPGLTFYEEEDKYPTITRKNIEEALIYYEH